MTRPSNQRSATEPGQGDPAPQVPGGRDIRDWAVAALERYGLLLLVVALALFFALHPVSGPAFRSSGNLTALLANQAVGLAVALALLVPLLAGFFDFSVGALTAATCLVAAAGMAHAGLPVAVAVALAVLTGLLIGTFTGFLVAYLEANAFIATLGVGTLLGGGIFAYTGGLQITAGISPALTTLGSRSWLGIPRIVVISALVALVVWSLMAQTPFGRRVTAVGANPRAAQLVGINVKRLQLLAFSVSGSVAGVAGVLLLARQGAATSDSGMAMLFPALTAVLLGTIVIDLGRPSVPGTVIGILFVAISVSGLTLIGVPAWVSQVFNGAALLVAVVFARISRRALIRSAG